jgi:hypothetical protein
LNPKQLYIRIITKRGDTFTSNNFVVKCRQDKPFTDEDADEALHNVVESLKRDLPEDATIIKAEFVPQQVFEYPIRDADKVMPWRTLDFVVQSLDYQFEPNQVGHPIFMPLALVRVLVDEAPSIMSLDERERIRAMVAAYIWDTKKLPVYSLNQIEPDTYWESLQMMRESKNDKVFLKVITKAELEKFWKEREAKRVAEAMTQREEEKANGKEAQRPCQGQVS